MAGPGEWNHGKELLSCGRKIGAGLCAGMAELPGSLAVIRRCLCTNPASRGFINRMEAPIEHR